MCSIINSKNAIINKLVAPRFGTDTQESAGSIVYDQGNLHFSDGYIWKRILVDTDTISNEQSNEQPLEQMLYSNGVSTVVLQTKSTEHIPSDPGFYCMNSDTNSWDKVFVTSDQNITHVDREPESAIKCQYANGSLGRAGHDQKINVEHMDSNKNHALIQRLLPRVYNTLGHNGSTLGLIPSEVSIAEENLGLVTTLLTKVHEGQSDVFYVDLIMVLLCEVKFLSAKIDKLSLDRFIHRVDIAKKVVI